MLAVLVKRGVVAVQEIVVKRYDLRRETLCHELYHKTLAEGRLTR